MRTAPIPDDFWTKHNKANDNGKIDPKPGVPWCTLCGRDLNPAKAFTVAVIDGGATFIHPDDVTAEVENDAGFMGAWDLGSSCALLAPMIVKKAYLS